MHLRKTRRPYSYRKKLIANKPYGVNSLRKSSGHHCISSRSPSIIKQMYKIAQEIVSVKRCIIYISCVSTWRTLPAERTQYRHIRKEYISFSLCGI